ncbi:MAG: metallophosphoesterase [Ruminococcus sp.]|nr:metallophosphoesterase [Ruminococcus sp.]MEE3429206.1 metallophosphoesterase [Ruminococcus sp.]
MSLFTIGDLHLSLGTDKPMDIFHGWDNYLDRITNNWNKIVKENDTVVIAGDISWAMKLSECDKDFAYIDSLPGKKILLKGNHDYWWDTASKINRYLNEKRFSSISILFNNSYEVDDFVICGTRGWGLEPENNEDIKILNRECGRLRLSLESAENSDKEKTVFLHYPPVYGGNVCGEIIDILKEYNVKKCYYGHIHGQKMIRGAFNGEYENIRFKLVSCDSVSFTPVLVR